MENHLNLADLHIGDWVQEYSDITGRLSCPMYIFALFEDGTVYLNFNGNEADIWEAEIKDLRPIAVDEDILKGFGFSKVKNDTDWHLHHNGDRIDFDVNNHFMKSHSNHSEDMPFLVFTCLYVHTMQHLYYEHTQYPLILEWKGVKQMTQ